jgi:hypothetical protein
MPTLEDVRHDGHWPSYSRSQAGFTALRPARPLYRSKVECECGWSHRGQAGFRKRDAEQAHNDHLREVREGTYEPEVEVVRADHLREGDALVIGLPRQDRRWEITRFQVDGSFIHLSLSEGKPLTYARSDKVRRVVKRHR